MLDIRSVFRCVVGVAALLAAVSAPAGAGNTVVVESWAMAARGVPDGWTAESWGKRADYDLAVVEHDGRRAIHLKSRGDRSTITRDVRGKVDLRETPILEWSWKVVTLPEGGDARRQNTTDQAAQVYVAWPRFPAQLRSRIVGYAWDTGAPQGAMLKSRKTGTVTYFIVRSGPGEAGKWITERRNVLDDFRRAYGEDPTEGPGAISISIDSNDTRSAAESYIGPIVFRAG